MGRMRMLVVVGSLWVGVAAAEEPMAGTRRVTRCCVELAIPEVPSGPVCVQVHARRPLRPRRACRLLGGMPIGRGDCSLAACRGPAA